MVNDWAAFESQAHTAEQTDNLSRTLFVNSAAVPVTLGVFGYVIQRWLLGLTIGQLAAFHCTFFWREVRGLISDALPVEIVLKHDDSEPEENEHDSD